jgi:hypothetical protein
MTDVKPDSPPDRWIGWTVPAIDAAIEVRWGKYAAAMARGDLSAAVAHEDWLDRLLDARLYVATTRGLT